MVSSFVQTLFFLKYSTIWISKKKKRQRIYDLLNAETEIIGVSLWPPSSLDVKPLDYDIRVVLENKTNAIFHLIVGSLKTTIEEEENVWKILFWKKANRFKDMLIYKF